MSACIRLHPENNKVFEFRGKPLMLITATEHYGAVMNRPFDIDRYLADAADKKMTVTRLFTLFRELQAPTNPYSTCKPESPDYVAPFQRTGPGRACDGQLKYDLAQWNPEFFDRLHRFVSRASELSIIVEIVLHSNTYGDHIFALNPLHPANNINGLANVWWPEFMTQRHAQLFHWQCAHVRKLVQELNRYDNVIYELCNEPGGNIDLEKGPSVAEVNQWLAALAKVVRDTEATLPNKHLIVGQEAFAYRLADESHRSGPDVHQFADATFDAMDFYDVVNMHPLSNMVYRGKNYDLGAFMQAELRLKNLRQYCLDATRERKPLSLDEDNSASQYKDVFGWTIHRKRAWTALLCGAHYDYIDFSIQNFLETGTPAAQTHLRAWMKHLSEFVHSIDLVNARPQYETVTHVPEHTIHSVLAVTGREYHVYLADARECDEPGCGAPIHGRLSINLPDGAYTVACFSPVTGQFSPSIEVHGGPQTEIALPQFVHDLALRIMRK